MIPKTIHYCWFGGKPLPPLAEKCIASWEKYCPDYEIIEWNEKNYDISSAPLYVRQAYEAKKWGFVPDYIRLELIYNYGGIYLDTDVEIVKPIDDLLNLKGYAGFESDTCVNFGLGFGAEKGNKTIKYLMDSYLDKPFLKEDGTPDITASPIINTLSLNKLGLVSNGQKQTVDGFVYFSSDYLCPKSLYTGKITMTSNTFSIHHFDGSWLSEEMIYIRDLQHKLIDKMPKKLAHWSALIIGFTKYRGLLKMPSAMIQYKKKNLKERKKLKKQ